MTSTEVESIEEEIDRILNLRNEGEAIAQINTKFERHAKGYRNNMGELFGILEYRLKCKSNKEKYYIFLMSALVFNKSHYFRMLFCMKIYELFKLVTNDGYWGNSSGRELRGEDYYGKRLRIQAYDNLARWCRVYGPGYPQLLDYKEFLKSKLKIDIDNIVHPYHHDKNVISLVNGRITVISEASIEHAKLSTTNRLLQQTQIKVQQSQFDIHISLGQINECLKLLKKDDLTSNSNKLKIINNKTRIDILSNNDNQVIITTLLDCVKLIRKQYIPLLEKYMQLIDSNLSTNENGRNAANFKKLLEQLKLMDKLFSYVHIVNETKEKTNKNKDFVDVNEADEHEILLDTNTNYFKISSRRKRSYT